jgi:hypothetical protein
MISPSHCSDENCFVSKSEFQQYRSGSKWMKRLREDTSRKNKLSPVYRWWLWLNQSGHSLSRLSPDGLIDYQLDSFGNRRRMFDILDNVQEWLDEMRTRGLRGR